MAQQFDVYCIGNALTDIVLQVSRKELEALNIAQGVTTLIDAQRHSELLHILDNKPHIIECGGSAGNTAIALNQFGSKAYYACNVANDFYGKEFIVQLEKAGVYHGLYQKTLSPAGHTGKCLVFVTEDGDRTMNTFVGSSSDLSDAHINHKALGNSHYLYIEGYLVAADQAFVVAKKTRDTAKELGIKMSLTLSDPNMVRFFRHRLDVLIQDDLDLLFCNEDEALTFCETTSLAEAANALKTRVKQFAITLGEKGALLYDGNEFTEIPANKIVCPLDTVGAGDMFAGAFLSSLRKGHSFVESGYIACMAASRIIQKLGARLSDNEAAQLNEEIKQKFAPERSSL